MHLEWRWVWGMFPALLAHSDHLPPGVAGEARGPLVRIRPAHADDAGLLAHELCHVRQWWGTLGLHALLYLTCRRYRLWAEVAAYREQLRHPPARDHWAVAVSRFAAALAGPRYRLGIGRDRAFSLLTEESA